MIIEIPDKQVEQVIEIMARRAAKASLPDDGLLQQYQLDYREEERMPIYRKIARIMLLSLISEEDLPQDERV